jgi:hypothetical protein
VGFVTSTDHYGLTSAILVSKQDALVYLCSTKPKGGDDEFALGYRIRNSMFGRQLLHLWSYKFRPGHSVKLRDLPAFLNSEVWFDDATGALVKTTEERVFCNGFQAAFVGAKTGEGFDGRVTLLGDCALSDFLPFAPLDPAAPVPDCDVGTFGEFIPPEDIGELVDDMRKYWTRGATYIQFRGLFIEITADEGGIKVVDPVPRQMYTDEPPLSIEISESIGAGSLTAAETPGRPRSQGPRVPWLALSLAIDRLVPKKKWHPIFPNPAPQKYKDFAMEFLTELNDAPPPEGWDFVYLFADFARVNEENREEFERLVREEFAALAPPPGSVGTGESPALETGDD